MSKLFDLTIATTNVDYLALRDNPKHSNAKQFCERMWKKFESYADTSFRNEFSNDLHPRFWEMYLATQLLDLGFILIPRKEKAGPDLHLLIDHRSIWIEATAPTEGSGSDAVPSLYNHCGINPLPEDQIILRFTNAISEKHNKLKKYIRDNIVSPEDAYIIAINGGRISILILETIPYVIKSIYPIGDIVTSFNTRTWKIISSRFEYSKEVDKKSGSSVSRNFFVDPTFSEISGILYSNAALWDLPDTPGNEFIYIHNSIANVRMKKGWLKVGKDYLLEGSRLMCSDFTN